MDSIITIRLARKSDAMSIAIMSRKFVETGLGWSWTSSRVISEIKAKDSNVIVTTKDDEVIGFAVMKYLGDEARLNLFAVDRIHRRKGIGTQMIKWLEQTALVYGSNVIYLETRLRNISAREFYKKLGYKVIQRIPGYYREIESAIRMARDLT